MFRSFQSVALLAGLFFGAVLTVDVAVPQEDNVPAYWIIIALALLILTPAVALRSPARILLGFVLYTLIKAPSYWILYPALFIDGRVSLPLVVWDSPSGPTTDLAISTNWQWRALVGLAVYMLFVDVVQVILRLPSFKPFGRMLRSITWRHLGAIALSMIPIMILYPISWRAKVSGTDLVPLYTQFEYYFSLAVFFLIFPIKHWLLHYLLDRADQRKLDSNEEVKSTVVAQEEST